MIGAVLMQVRELVDDSQAIMVHQCSILIRSR
jgi:hypothetical protein